MDMLEKVNQVSELKSVRQLQIERGATGSVAGSFGQLLQERMNHREQGVQFSKHAAQRVQQRGIQVTENFQRPFFSKNVAEYWRRWHITMGSWFRDYIFYPVSISKTMLAGPRR